MARQDKLLSFPLHLSRELDRLFEELIHRPWGFTRELVGWSPSLDLYETSEAFIVEADLPGVKEEDISVDVDGNNLILQGRRAFKRDYSNGKFHCQERCFGDFTRQITLPESVDKDKIRAEFSNGVLKVILSKIKEKKKG